MQLIDETHCESWELDETVVRAQWILSGRQHLAVLGVVASESGGSLNAVANIQSISSTNCSKQVLCLSNRLLRRAEFLFRGPKMSILQSTCPFPAVPITLAKETIHLLHNRYLQCKSLEQYILDSRAFGIAANFHKALQRLLEAFCLQWP